MSCFSYSLNLVQLMLYRIGLFVIWIHMIMVNISPLKEKYAVFKCNINFDLFKYQACVLCGYEGGAMTRAVRSQNIVKSLLKAWKEGTGKFSTKSAPSLPKDGSRTLNPSSKVSIS